MPEHQTAPRTSTKSSKAESCAKASSGLKRTRSAGMGTKRLQHESVETRRTAALILEVLAGVRTPTEAAEVLGVSPPRYYMLEARALKGLVVACRRRPRGPTRSAEREVARLQQELKRLERECDRYQALLRLAERTVGVPAQSAKPSKTSKKSSSTSKKRKRRPVARALRAAKALEVSRENSVDEPAPPGDHAADVKS